MSCKLICNWENQQEIRPLSAQFKANFDNLSELNQVVVLKKLLGVEFYNEIIANIDSTEAKWTNLLNGCDFVYSGYSYKNEGLRTFLAHLNVAEWQIKGKMHETASGLIIKTNQDYDQISFAAQKQAQAELKEFAYTFWTEIERYIILNSGDYRNYMVAHRKSEVNTPIISKIG